MAVEALYSDLETGTALKALRVLVSKVPEPLVLLGGWAVYFTVRDDFSREYGSDYLGSRDIDLGFHIDPGMDAGRLRGTILFRTLDVMRGLGYVPDGMFRFCRALDRETGRPLTEEESRALPVYDMFPLYVDPIIDNIHPDHERVFGFKPIDEPVLARVFGEGLRSGLDIGGETVHVPAPGMLAAMKLSSFPSRTRDDKKVKDACDIYALLWNSPVGLGEMAAFLRRDYPAQCSSARELLDRGIAARASRHLGIEREVYAGVMGQLLEEDRR